jgi:hypothetical protein
MCGFFFVVGEISRAPLLVVSQKSGSHFSLKDYRLLLLGISQKSGWYFGWRD